MDYNTRERKGGRNMANSTISREVIDIVKKQVEKEVKRSIEAIIKARIELDAAQRNYFKETERLLYSLPALKLKLAQDEEDLKNGLVKFRERSRDVIKPSQGGYGPSDPEAKEERYIAERKASMERTKREIQRIERALETIQDDEYYDIIPLKYWDLLSPAEIAERLNCDERTFYRHKNRLINKLKVVLFGADAL
jgi:RNA polymerase sigma factor (sigma-70 family)